MQWIFSCLLLSLSFLSFADVSIKVIDTGAGLATVTRFPNGDIMVYDTGHWSYQNQVFQQFQNFISDADIDLLVVSHSDADHLSATDELFNEFRIQHVIRTGLERDTTNWENHNNAIESAAAAGLTHDINLGEVALPHGTTYQFGDAIVTFLSGYHEPPANWGLTGSEFRNGNSIVMRVEYQGHSALYTGDAVGRVEDSAPDAPAIATERYLIDNAQTRPINSTVLIAPHHGSDDASSQEFIRAVGARWVIFSAGHDHEHPRQVTAERFLDLGYTENCLLRTDLGDNEGDDEWSFGQTDNSDGAGDDSVEIVLHENGELPSVNYEGEPAVNCPQVAMTAEDQPNNGVQVKKSRSGICHDQSSAWYTRTVNFTAYPDIGSCLASGGRLPNSQ